MATRKQLAEIAILSVAMPATVFLCLWVLFGVLRIDRLLGVPKRELSLLDSGQGAIGIVPGEGHWLKMQRALIKKGYSIHPTGPHGQDDTLTALGISGRQRVAGAVEMRSAVLDRAWPVGTPSLWMGARQKGRIG